MVISVAVSCNRTSYASLETIQNAIYRLSEKFQHCVIPSLPIVKGLSVAFDVLATSAENVCLMDGMTVVGYWRIFPQKYAVVHCVGAGGT